MKRKASFKLPFELKKKNGEIRLKEILLNLVPDDAKEQVDSLKHGSGRLIGIASITCVSFGI